MLEFFRTPYATDPQPRLTLCAGQKPLMQFQHLDQLIRLGNSLTSGGNRYMFATDVPGISVAGVNTELIRLHQASQRVKDLILGAATIKYNRHGKPYAEKLQPVGLGKILDEVTQACKQVIEQQSRGFVRNALLERSQDLETIKASQQTTSNSSVRTEPPQSLEGVPVLIVKTQNINGWTGTRVIINPKFAEQAKACEREYETSFSYAPLDAYRNAVLARDPRVCVVSHSDLDLETTIRRQKYADELNGIQNEGWEAKALSLILKTAEDGKLEVQYPLTRTSVA